MNENDNPPGDTRRLDPGEARWQALAKNAPDIVGILDLELRFLWLNRAVVPVEQLIGNSILEGNPPEDHARIRAVYDRVRETGEPKTYETEAVGADGSLGWWSVSVGQDVGPDGEVQGFVAFARDITEQRRTLDSLRRREAELFQSQKMEAVGQLAAGIAHDFNNLLTGILGFSQFALQRLDPDHPVVDDIEQVQRASQRAADLTRRLLAFSRQQVLQAEVADPADILQAAEPVLRRAAREDTEILLELEEGEQLIHVDATLLEQAVLNLVINARDAMPSGGTLTIATHRAPTPRLIGQLPAGTDCVCVSVRDTGEGMDAATCARVLEPFFSTKPAGRGTGLGLPMVAGFVEQSGGAINVESELGRGTTVTLWFPRVPSAEAGHVSDLLTRPEPPSKPVAPANILVVEDEDSIRGLIARVLRAQGHRVTTCADGAEGLTAAEAGLDLLITDMVMPTMNGWELVRQLRPKHRHLRVLYITGYADSGILDREVVKPGLPLLRKPFTPEQLESWVARLLSDLDPPDAG